MCFCCRGVFPVLTLYSPRSIVWGLFFSPHLPHVMLYFSSIPCLPVLSTPLSYMYVVYVWTGWWLISLVLVTSDNKGLLLLLTVDHGASDNKYQGLELIKCIPWMQCKSVWAKVSAKCKNVCNSHLKGYSFTKKNVKVFKYLLTLWENKSMSVTISIKNRFLIYNVKYFHTPLTSEFLSV